MKLHLLYQYIKFFHKPNSQDGFTLIELLLASVMSIFVVGSAGYGLVSILGASSSSEAKTQRQIELNRALEFIAEEVKMSNKVEWSSGLKLTIPSPASTITYSVAATPSNSIWLNDYTVKRGSDTLVDGLKNMSFSDTCSTGIKGSNGFYACIYSGNRRVDLYLYGKTGSKSTDYVKVKTTAFARAQ